MTTYVPPTGIKNPLPNIVQASQLAPTVPFTNAKVIPPPPLPETLFGTTAVTSYST